MFGGSAGQAQIRERFIVDREEGRGRAELGRHVGDRGPVGQGQPRQSVAGELDKRADNAVRAEHLGHHQDEVRSRGPFRQRAREADADDLRHRLVQRLAEQHGFGLDSADAVAQDTESVDHRGVRIGPNERVRERDFATTIWVAAARHHGRQVLEIHLVDDAGSGRNDSEIVEGGLGPAQQLIALAVPFVLPPDVEGEGIRGAVVIDLDRMVDDQIRRHQRVDPGRVAAEGGHCVAHGR